MEDIEWNVSSESKLFEALLDHKPVGVNKYFQMLFIWDSLQDVLDISSDKIWTHLESMYNLESMDDNESLPFPNDEREFYLPDDDFSNYKNKKEEKIDDKTIKPNTLKKSDVKESPKTAIKEIKKEDKVPGKKDTQRRDSKDGRDARTPVNVKKDIKKEVDKSKPVKGKTNSITKEDDRMKTPKTDDANKRQNKRPTRGSMRPEDLTGNKSQSPLTISTPTSTTKRRRL